MSVIGVLTVRTNKKRIGRRFSDSVFGGNWVNRFGEMDVNPGEYSHMAFSAEAAIKPSTCAKDLKEVHTRVVRYIGPTNIKWVVNFNRPVLKRVESNLGHVHLVLTVSQRVKHIRKGSENSSSQMADSFCFQHLTCSLFLRKIFYNFPRIQNFSTIQKKE